MMVEYISNTSAGLKGRMAARGISQESLAIAMGIDQATMSRILSGKRRMPASFIDRAHATLDRLERAKAAAQAEYDRVLAEAAEEEK